MDISYYDVDEEVYNGTYDSLPHIPRIGERVMMGSDWFPINYRVVDVVYNYTNSTFKGITIHIKEERKD